MHHTGFKDKAVSRFHASLHEERVEEHCKLRKSSGTIDLDNFREWDATNAFWSKLTVFAPSRPQPSMKRED
jgi:hypothetical protein